MLGRGDRPQGDGMEREERTRIGRSPLDTRPGGAGRGPGEERPRIGRSPQEPAPAAPSGRGEPQTLPGGPRDSTPRDTVKPNRMPFAQDGLETREPQRPVRTREAVTSAELFEKPAAPRPTGERPRPQGTEGAASSNFETPDLEPTPAPERASSPADSLEVPSPTSSEPVERAETRPDAPDVAFDEPAPTPSRAPSSPRTEGKPTPDALETRAPEQPAPTEGKPAPDAPDALETRAPEQAERPAPTEGETPADTGFETPEGKPLPSRAPRTQEPRGETRFEPPPPPTDAEPPVAGRPVPPGVPGPPRRIEDLLPKFDESIGQESLAHHFSEEVAFLGAELRPSRMPPGERALRLWAFFAAYARANAKDPEGQSPAGRARFEQALLKNGFGGLRDAATGKTGVETALVMLASRSPEELQSRLAEVRIEPGPEQLPSEVFLPVVDERAPEKPARAAPEKPAKAAAPEAPVAKKAEPPVDPDDITQPEELPGTPAKAPAEAKTAAEGKARPAGAEAAPFDQQEPKAVVPQGLSASVPNPALVPPRVALAPRDALEDGAEPVVDRRGGTNKRLGPHMLWNALHGLRDPAEDSAVLKEKWSQLAFGSIVALVGAALLVAMLASL
ncbi:hypothetical protein [Melittangium boletus]|uniref:hypothetical protein n=1 Tax=Melittangium boletus TaxID=83453 RepID=UPI003DA431A3